MLGLGLFVCGGGRAFADPQILSLNPVNGTTTVAVNTAITVMFSDAMDTSSIGTDTTSTGTFTVYIDGTTPTYVSGNITVVGNVAKFTPSGDPLSASTLYTCKMATGTTNLYGSSSTGASWTFTTGGSSDNAHAGVWYTSPYDNATNVAVSTSLVYIIFNERQDATTIGTTTITLSSDSGSVGGTVAYYDYGENYVGTPTATFSPSSNLTYSTRYTITTSNVVKDMAGNRLDGTHTASFTTGSAPSSGGEVMRVEKLYITGKSPHDSVVFGSGMEIFAQFNMLLNTDDINSDGTLGWKVPTGGRDDDKFFILKDSNGDKIAGRTVGEGMKVKFEPSSVLAVGEYTTTVTTSVQAANAVCTQMESSYSWTFTIIDSSSAPKMTKVHARKKHEQTK